MNQTYIHDKDIVTQYATWLQTFHWDLFGTLTFDLGRQCHSEPSRKKLLVTYHQKLERKYRRHIRCFWSEEKTWSGCGRPAIAPHFHILLACDRTPLTPDYPRALWEELAGKADIRVYDPSLNGAFYCAKLIAYRDTQYGIEGFKCSQRTGPFVRNPSAAGSSVASV